MPYIALLLLVALSASVGALLVVVVHFRLSLGWWPRGMLTGLAVLLLMLVSAAAAVWRVL